MRSIPQQVKSSVEVRDSDRYRQHGKSYYDMTVGTSTIINVHHAVHLRNTLNLSNPFASSFSYDSLPFDN